MNIVEIRSQLSARLASQGFGSFPTSAPDWVIERIHQKENGLPLSPVPIGTRVLKNNAELRSFVAQTKPAPAKIMENKAVADAEMERLRLRYLNISH